MCCTPWGCRVGYNWAPNYNNNIHYAVLYLDLHDLFTNCYKFVPWVLSPTSHVLISSGTYHFPVFTGSIFFHSIIKGYHAVLLFLSDLPCLANVLKVLCVVINGRIPSFLVGVVLVAQEYLTLCDPMDYSLPGSSVHGIFQARVPEWGAIAFSKFLY